MLLIIPVTVRALCEGTITLTGKIEIDGKKDFCIITYDCYGSVSRNINTINNLVRSRETFLASYVRFCSNALRDNLKVPFSKPPITAFSPIKINEVFSEHFIQYKDIDKMSEEYLKTLFDLPQVYSYLRNEEVDSKFYGLEFVSRNVLSVMEELVLEYDALSSDVEKITNISINQLDFSSVDSALYEYYNGDLTKIYAD